MTNFRQLSEFYRGKKVLLTGHTGFKGSYMTVLLGLMGAEVYGYSLKPNTEPALFDILYGNGVSSRNETELYIRTGERARAGSGITESRIGDIRDLDALQSFYNRIEPDIVIHMAAQPIVRESYRIPRETYETNVMGTVNLLECVRLHPCCRSILNVTTDKVYYNEERPGYAYREEDKLDGYDPYSNSKSCSELVTHSYAASFLREQGVAVSTARAGNVIGGGDFAADRIMPDCVRAALGSGEIYLRNPGSIRPYQHVFEPLFVYLTIAMGQYLEPAYAGWYNVGPDREDCVTTGELCGLFRDCWGSGLTVSRPEHADGPHESGLLLLDNQLIKRTFGWRPVWRIGDAVRAICSWTKAWQGGGSEAANRELLRQIAEYTG